MLEVIARNYNRGIEGAKLFELAHVYLDLPDCSQIL